MVYNHRTGAARKNYPMMKMAITVLATTLVSSMPALAERLDMSFPDGKNALYSLQATGNPYKANKRQLFYEGKPFTIEQRHCFLLGTMQTTDSAFSAYTWLEKSTDADRAQWVLVVAGGHNGTNASSTAYFNCRLN
jgi:hypothetical protein